jgi:hypothetical protein
MESEVADLPQEHSKQPLGLRHIAWVFARPRKLFDRVEDSGAYGWALILLLALIFLIGYAQVQTGLIDRVVDRQTEQVLADMEESQATLVDRIELREQMEEIRKLGEFNKLMARLGAIVVAPLVTLSSFLLIASILYAVVALTGRKPEYHTLMGICVYAGFVEVSAYGLRLLMMLCYRTTEVNTSLGMFVFSGEPTWLAGIDPFRLWFWGLVALGLVTTQQLRKRTAILSCAVMCLVAIGARIAMEYAPRAMG